MSDIAPTKNATTQGVKNTQPKQEPRIFPSFQYFILSLLTIELNIFFLYPTRSILECYYYTFLQTNIVISSSIYK